MHKINEMVLFYIPSRYTAYLFAPLILNDSCATHSDNFDLNVYVPQEKDTEFIPFTQMELLP